MPIASRIVRALIRATKAVGLFMAGQAGLGLRLVVQALEADERAGGEQFAECSAIGQEQLGREFGQGIENERPCVHMVVGHLQAGVVEYSVAE